jgi:protein SERAC1
VNTQADDAHLIYEATKGLIFLGTPHAGSAVDQQKRIWILKKIAKAAFTQVPPKLESALELHSDELRDLADDFRRITLWTERKLIVYTYYTDFENVWGKIKILKRKAVPVTPGSN